MSSSTTHPQWITHDVSLPFIHACFSSKGGTNAESKGKSTLWHFTPGSRISSLFFFHSLIIGAFLSCSTSRTPLYSVFWSSPLLYPATKWTCPTTRAFWAMSAPTILRLCYSLVILHLSCFWKCCVALPGFITALMKFQTQWDNTAPLLLQVRSQIY